MEFYKLNKVFDFLYHGLFAWVGPLATVGGAGAALELVSAGSAWAAFSRQGWIQLGLPHASWDAPEALQEMNRAALGATLGPTLAQTQLGPWASAEGGGPVCFSWLPGCSAWAL